MKDYYKILGVEEEASEEEIRARWVELTKRYHPDVGGMEDGDEKIREINEAYEILKDEPSRFHYDFERDLKRSFIKKAHREQERRTNIRKIIIIPSGILVLFCIVGFFLLRSGRVPAPPKTEVFPRSDGVSKKMTASRTPPVKTDSKTQEVSKALKEIKKEVIPQESEKMVSPDRPREIPPLKAEKEARLRVSLEQAPGLQAGESKGSLSRPRSPSPVERESEQKKESTRKILPESEVPASAPFLPPAEKESESKERLASHVATKSEIPATKKVSEEIAKETLNPTAKELPKETPKQIAREVPKEAPKEVPKEPSTEAPKQVSKEIMKEASKEKEVPKEVSKEAPKEIPKQVAKEVVKEAPKEVIKEVPKEVPKEAPKEIPKQVTKEVPKEVPKEVIKVNLHPGEKLTMWTKEERTVPSRPSLLAKEEEVRQFFSNYVDRYNRKDVNGFLSFFSSKALQNQTDGLEAIGNVYTRWIDQSEELRYQIEGMKIEIYPHRVDVKARFRLDQKLKKDGEEKVWKGNIRWVLVKEKGRLKVSSLDYQNE